MYLKVTRTSNDVFRYLTCTDEQFKEIVEQSINDEPDFFSFQDLIYSIKNKVEFEKEANTEYNLSPKFLPKYLNVINCAIWDRIWDKKMLFNFGNEDRPLNEVFKFQFVKLT